MNKYEIDYEKLFNIIKEKKLVITDVSYKCGKSKNWLTQAKYQNSMMLDTLCDILANVIGCDVSEFIKVYPITTEEADINSVLSDVVDEVLTISDKLDKLTQIIVSQQADIIAILMENDSLSSAVAILNALLCGNGKCKESVYRNACLKRKINEETMKKALESVGAHYFMHGSGQNGIRWITK